MPKLARDWMMVSWVEINSFLSAGWSSEGSFHASRSRPGRT